MLVKDKKLRDALSPRVCRTLEMVFRKLAAGVEASEVIPAVAQVIGGTNAPSGDILLRQERQPTILAVIHRR